MFSSALETKSPKIRISFDGVLSVFLGTTPRMYVMYLYEFLSRFRMYTRIVLYSVRSTCTRSLLYSFIAEEKNDNADTRE